MKSVESWSIDEWCNQQTPTSWDDIIHTTSIEFLLKLNLTFIHPYCNPNTKPNPYNIDTIPNQGPLVHYDHIESIYDSIITYIMMIGPSLYAMIELWLRLFSFYIAPISILYLLYIELFMTNSLYLTSSSSSTNHEDKEQKQRRRRLSFVSFICLISVATSAVLVKDTLYNMEFGPLFGGTLFVLSFTISYDICMKYKLYSDYSTLYSILMIVCIVFYVIYDHSNGIIKFGDPNQNVLINEGLYYNKSNQFAQQIVHNWPESSRNYQQVATPWLVTGDSQTGIPFLINRIKSPKWIRVWLPLQSDGEVLALDISFPKHGYDPTKPIYMILHGLNGGSNEEYVKDLTLRRNEHDNITVIVMIARGLMDLPIRSYNVFHGARWTDSHEAAVTIRKALIPGQLLVGVGYSMGAIILSNMITRTGIECALDVAVAISGGLDMRPMIDFPRAQRLWQPLLLAKLRDDFAIGKWGERVRSRLTKRQMKDLMRATYVTEFDRTAVVAYNGFRDIVHYYSEMSALGDVPYPSDEYFGPVLPSSRRIHNISIPFCVVHALDDPLVTWRTVAANHGLMHPQNLTSLTGSGNLFLLLTKRGGHVGWPTGWIPNIDAWKWMSDISMSFVTAVIKAQTENRNNDDR